MELLLFDGCRGQWFAAFLVEEPHAGFAETRDAGSRTEMPQGGRNDEIPAVFGARLQLNVPGQLADRPADVEPFQQGDPVVAGRLRSLLGGDWR